MKFDIIGARGGFELHIHRCYDVRLKERRVLFTSDDPVALAEYCWDSSEMREYANDAGISYREACRDFIWDIVTPCTEGHW